MAQSGHTVTCSPMSAFWGEADMAKATA